VGLHIIIILSWVELNFLNWGLFSEKSVKLKISSSFLLSYNHIFYIFISVYIYAWTNMYVYVYMDICTHIDIKDFNDCTEFHFLFVPDFI
jgi:hypothetical protein